MKVNKKKTMLRKVCWITKLSYLHALTVKRARVLTLKNKHKFDVTSTRSFGSL